MPLPLRNHALLAPGLAVLLALAAGCGGGDDGDAGAGNTFTLHYHRAAEDYAGWSVEATAGAETASVAAAGTDAFGARYEIPLAEGATALEFSLAREGAADAAGALSVDLAGGAREAWVISGHPEAITRELPALPANDDQVAVYYLRGDGRYSGWGLHTWGDVANETGWTAPLMPAGVDPVFGAGFVIDVAPGGDRINVIAHKGDTKDPGPDMGWSRAELGDIVFMVTGSAAITATPRAIDFVSGAAAHLLASDTVVWNVTDAAATGFELRYSPAGEIVATEDQVTGGEAVALTPRGGPLSAELAARFPHLASWRVFDVAAPDLPKVKAALKGQLVAVARRSDGTRFAATQVQSAPAIDELYAFDGGPELGVTFAGDVPTFRLWAPTAQAVTLHVHDASSGAELAAVELQEGASGVWEHTGPAEWDRQHYRYAVTAFHPSMGRVETALVTDPWAVNLSTNGEFAQVVDLADADLAPPGWSALVKPPLAAPEDIVVYESHIRDFSATDPTAPADRRGKYLAFESAGETPSAGLAHLAALADAGLTHVHLLPAFDFATVNEDETERVDLDDDFSLLCARNPSVPAATCGEFTGSTIREALEGLPGDSERQQEIATWLAGLDSFNWGYDPFHYGAPEGSYASTAEGTAKIVEFRRMVQGLADVGLRVVMDVVYNHTNAAGLAPRSVLDKVVPGYYHRLNPETGAVESSSCCANTATEHRMMERLMIDTAVRWARDYQVDGFRFDLMGLHLRSNMERVRDALAAVRPDIYVYGEGWDMGELQNAARGVNASQLNMGGAGIGMFNDRLRDGVRGGGPFDSGNAIRQGQGFVSGLFYDPNELASGSEAEKAKLAQAVDLVKLGMAGNLRSFRMVTWSGGVSDGWNVAYNGVRAGYAQDPQETVNYVSAHDNQTLWDILQMKMPAGRAMADRVRAHNLALDVVALGQGVAFFHMGDDLLRSKSVERDSYDSGDWFNRVDWSMTETAWESGLPNESKDVSNWPIVRALFADPTIDPRPEHVAAAAAHLQEMLRVRRSSPLFRLRTAGEVETRVDFTNGGTDQVPGVIVMTITDDACAGPDLDPARDALVVVVNADVVEHTMPVAGAAGFELHGVLAGSADAIVKTAVAGDGTFTVPPRTTAVFEKRQGASRGAGLPCNTR